MQISISATVTVSDAASAAVLSAGFAEIFKELKKIMDAIADLQAQVAQNLTVEGSALTLIQGFSAQLSAAGSDPTKLEALVTQLNTSATSLAAAVAANTPAVAPAPASTS